VSLARFDLSLLTRILVLLAQADQAFLPHLRHAVLDGFLRARSTAR
jgi:hypothetical protein